MRSKMDKVVKKHWKNGFNYQHEVTGVRKGFWSYSFRIGKYGIMISKPSKFVSFINIYELI